MKKHCFLIILFANLLHAQDQVDTLILETNIEGVTVFFNGAEINRTGNLRLNPGKHILQINNLAESLFPSSLQVNGVEGVTILSVKQDKVKGSDKIAKNIVRNLNDTIEQIKIEIRRIKNRINILEVEEEILMNNSIIGNEKDGIQIDELEKAANFYRKRLTFIRNEIINLSLNVNSKKDEIVEKYKEINEKLVNLNKFYSQLSVSIECSKVIKNKIYISYYIPSAGWNPTYDFRVQKINEPLNIVYNANVYQSSSEDWNKVNLTLSSNNPSLSGYKPELQKWILGDNKSYTNKYPSPNSNTQIPSYGGVSSIKGKITSTENNEPIPFANVTLLQNNDQLTGTTTDFEGNYLLKPIDQGTYDLQVSYVGYQTRKISGLSVKNDFITIQNAKLSQGIELKEVEVIQYNKPLLDIDDNEISYSQKRKSIDQSTGYSSARGSRGEARMTIIDGLITEESSDLIDYTINKNAISLEYEIKIPYSIPSDGKDYNIKIKEERVIVDYEYQIAPRIDPDAFLIAYLKDWENLNLLSGKAALYYQGTYTGESYINSQQAEDTILLSLGRDKQIFVKREENKEMDSRQVFSNNIKETIGWDIVVKNNKSSKVKIKLEDQYPISNRKNIESKLISYEGAKNNEKKGFLNWEFELEPSNKKDFFFSYEVKYPSYKELQIR